MDVRIVPDIEVHGSRLKKCEGRFVGVFNKLNAWGLTEFEKVILLDVDTLVLKPLDELFGSETPMAMFRGNNNTPMGCTREPGTFFNRRGKAKFGINAGVISLKPSAVDLGNMSETIRSKSISTHVPEQDFLSAYFCDRWHALAT